MDPLTDHYPFYTPYQYAGCEPIANVDVDGLEPFNALQTLGEVIVVSSYKLAKVATPALTGLSKAISITRVSLQIMNAATNIINTSITTKQAGGIGNPADPSTIRAKQAMQMTEEGRKAWSAMENDKAKTYYFYEASNRFNSGDEMKNLKKGFSGDANMGKTLTESQYNSLLETGKVSDESKNSAYQFDESTGNNVKTDDWKKTYILLNVDAIEDYSQNDVVNKTYTMENARAFHISTTIYHEWIHTRQKTYNNYKAKFNPKTKKYVNTSGQDAFKIKHENRPEETEAETEEEKIKSQFKSLYGGQE